MGEVRRITTNLLRATDGRDVLLNDPDGWEVEQPWLWWTGAANGAPGPFGHPIPGAEPWANWASLPAVGRATSLVVDTLAGLPWHVFRGTERLPTPDWITDPQALRLDGRVVDPTSVADVRQSAMDFWTQWLTSALWWDHGYVYVPQRDVEGAPKAPLYVLHPADVEIEAGHYRVGDTELGALEVIHLRGMGGVFRRFAAELGYTLRLKDYAAGVFYSGVPAGYLKVLKEGMSQESADALKAKWLAAHGNGTRNIAVLNSTTEFHPLTFTPVDAELIGAINANLNELALAFGLPAAYLGGSTDPNTYANIESRRMDLAMFTHLPWARRIEAVLDAQFARGTSLKVSLDAIIRADTLTRFQTYAIAIDKGILTVDEVRALEDYPPLFEPVEVPTA